MIRTLGIWLWLAACSLANVVQVDLGYSTYQGVANSTTGLNTFFGVRYAAAPIGSLRWQAPQSPSTNRSSVITADTYSAICPNSPLSLGSLGYYGQIYGDEDCLFLNVYAPANATKLPVLVYIHGGGYGAGNGQQDLSSLINANANGFVGVAIQYRLGVFGFLSSAEVKSQGVLNAGILDQNFALQWVQKYISKFGGDPARVTISGESAGAGSVMLHDIAKGGTLGTSLFINSITASPYLPQQFNYDDAVPTAYYNAFAVAAGCPTSTNLTRSSTFSCLTSKNSTVLQTAGFTVGGSAPYGTWGFAPVTDGTYIQQRPSTALLTQQVNGLKHLSGNNANEGNLFVTAGLSTKADLASWVNTTYPYLTSSQQTAVLQLYPVNSTQTAEAAAYGIYGEATLICPSYWLAQAYTKNNSYQGYKYQYSVPIALHGTDTYAYFGPPTENQGPDFVKAFQKIWGNFIINNNPSISNAIANGASSGSTAPNTASNWPTFSVSTPNMINLNETGGVITNVTTEYGVALEAVGPTLRNDIELVNAYTFGGNRGARCDFWRLVGANIPE